MSDMNLLIDEIIEKAKGIEYDNEILDVVIERSEMMIRKIFGDDSHYIKKLNSISYTPNLTGSGTPSSIYRDCYYRGKNKLLNLLNIIKEDLSFDQQSDTKIKKDTKQVSNNDIFIVHGHSEEMKLAVARTIDKLELNPIILHELPNKGRTIIKKFSDSSIAQFAIVLLSADDYAYEKNGSPDNGKFRARQNVIFELGYFIGFLGIEKVLVLYQETDNFEIPSDYSGVLFVPFDKNGKWKFDLVKELNAVGIVADANKIL